MENKIIANYTNGGTSVTIYKDGTKVRNMISDKVVEFPESIDVKITNYCDLNCKYCHENSTIEGVHCNINSLLEVLDELPRGIELAIGGGNPLSHPELEVLLLKLKDKGFICNLTINSSHILKYKTKILLLLNKNLIYGLGISYNSKDVSLIRDLMLHTNNIVIHLIAGVSTIKVLDELQNYLPYLKVLILGYKKFGRGIDYYDTNIDSIIREWSVNINKYFGKFLIAFDNLALEQLDIKRFFGKEWDSIYMGDDFSHSMYIDAVNKEYAKTSRSIDRISFNNIKLKEYFKK